MDITKLPKHIQEKVYKPPPDEIYYSETHVGDAPKQEVKIDLSEEETGELVTDSQ